MIPTVNSITSLQMHLPICVPFRPIVVTAIPIHFKVHLLVWEWSIISDDVICKTMTSYFFC